MDIMDKREIKKRILVTICILMLMIFAAPIAFGSTSAVKHTAHPLKDTSYCMEAYEVDLTTVEISKMNDAELEAKIKSDMVPVYYILSNHTYGQLHPTDDGYPVIDITDETIEGIKFSGVDNINRKASIPVQFTITGKYTNEIPVKVLSFTDGELYVNVTYEEPVAEVLNVKIKLPGNKRPELMVGKSMSLKANVDGVNDPDRHVKWSISGQKSSKTFITHDGKVFIGDDETATAIVVTATSVFDDTKSDSIKIKIRKPSPKETTDEGSEEVNNNRTVVDIEKTLETVTASELHNNAGSLDSAESTDFTSGNNKNKDTPSDNKLTGSIDDMKLWGKSVDIENKGFWESTMAFVIVAAACVLATILFAGSIIPDVLAIRWFNDKKAKMLKKFKK